MAIKEYLLSTNNFKRPDVLEGQDAIYTLLIRLALLNPGTIQTHPDMGLGLIENFRYTFDSDLENLKQEYTRQIKTYLPSLNLVDVLVKLIDHTLVLQIQIDNTIYPIYMDTETKTLKDFA